MGKNHQEEKPKAINNNSFFPFFHIYTFNAGQNCYHFSLDLASRKIETNLDCTLKEDQ